MSSPDDDFQRLSGPEHYLRGQELLHRAEKLYDDGDPVGVPNGLAYTHFTAAMAAAFGALLVSNEATQGNEEHVQQVANWAQVLGMSAGVDA